MLDLFSSQAPPRHCFVLFCFVQFDREDKLMGASVCHLIVTMCTVMNAEYVTRFVGAACSVSSLAVMPLCPLLSQAVNVAFSYMPGICFAKPI